MDTFATQMIALDATIATADRTATAAAGTLAASLEELMGEPDARILAEEAYMEAETTPDADARVFWTAYAEEICRRGALFSLMSGGVSEGVADLLSRLDEEDRGLVSVCQ